MSTVGATVLALKPENGTNNAGICSACKIAAGNILPPPKSLMHWEHNINGKGGGGNMGEAVVQKKMSTWAPTRGANYCLLKPRQWLQRTEAYPSTQTKDDLAMSSLDL
eukprot:13430632-Ditylum_brightwellii.AAC.1